MRVLVASASAKTAQIAVHELSASGVDVIALVRNPESAAAVDLAKLPHVTIVKGDLDDEKSIDSALVGAHRALLVSAAGQHEQFDRETAFIAAAQRAGVESIVRVSTYAGLIHTGSTGVYARAHACIRAYVDLHKAPVIDLEPNWFFDNWLSSAAEAKAAGTISVPTEGKRSVRMIDPRDVGRAAAAILVQPKEVVDKFIAKGRIEVHGPAELSLLDKAAALSNAAGYPIRLVSVPPIAWRDTLVGYGLTKLFATSFLHTVQIVGGDLREDGPSTGKTDPLLTQIGWAPKYDVKAWATSAHVAAAFRK